MSALRRQIELLLTAVQFLTRLPTPHLRGFKPDWPVRATRFFPLVGHGVGLFSAAVWVMASHVWSAPVAATLAVATSALATGGFHEDGLADTFDALGGATRDRRLAIMKDSRIGSYGALALLVSGALRLGALATLPPLTGALALVVAHGAARAAAICVMRLTPYAGDVEGAKGRPADARVGVGEALFAAMWGFAPILLLGPLFGAAAALLMLACVAGALRTTVKLFGGHTGDVLGATEQAGEVLVLLVASASFSL